MCQVEEEGRWKVGPSIRIETNKKKIEKKENRENERKKIKKMENVTCGMEENGGKFRPLLINSVE